MHSSRPPASRTTSYSLPTLLTCCLIFLSALATRAQHFTYIEIDSSKGMWGDWAEPDWLRYFGLDAGDVDRDGNLDILSGRYIYHNPGGGMTQNWKRTVLDDNVDGILFLDVDGDPFADLIAQALPDIFWYEAIDEAGTRYRRKKIAQVPATSHVNSQGFEKAQIIPGGNMEILIAGDGDIYCIASEPDASGEVNWQVFKICENTSDEGIGVGDIDGDGDLDIAAGRRPEGESEPKSLVWFENPGTTREAWQDREISASPHPIDRVEIADMDGDGLGDIIATEERYPGLEPDANLYWFQNQEGDGWKKHTLITQFSMNNLDVLDYDRDGDPDILTAEHKGEALAVQLWENLGEGRFDYKVVGTGKENHLGTQFADMDGDGDYDIIGAGWDQHQFIHLWRNDAVGGPGTGSIYREYRWVPENVGDSGKFLRVGGRLDYRENTDHFPSRYHDNGKIPLPGSLDLTLATRAEVLVERVQSHEDTRNLEIRFNDGGFHVLPEPTRIPEPRTDYMFHSNVMAAIPLTELYAGDGNHFELRVGPDQAWDWPQNLVYGIVLRVYYEPAKAKADGMLTSLYPGGTIEKLQKIGWEGTPGGILDSVSFEGLYEDVDWQGNGVYRQWQSDYHRGRYLPGIGTAREKPFELQWDTDWLPNQTQPVSVRARLHLENGLHVVTEPARGLKLVREASVKLLKPMDQPPFWVTRNDNFSSKLYLPEHSSDVMEAQIYWRSWSPCYSTGLQINDCELPGHPELPCYDTYWHAETVEPGCLEPGDNRVTTLKTPLIDGKMVHGMEVQWPGIMMKVKGSWEAETVEVDTVSYQNRPHFAVRSGQITYYFDIRGGGFSRILDADGQDWIGFKTDTTASYPASAARSYRGLPNLVFGTDDSGAGHPGFDRCTSTFHPPNRIRTETLNGRWQWEWTFEGPQAQLNVLRAPGDPYWFLYEGTPGGRYEPGAYYWGADGAGRRETLPGLYEGSSLFGKFQWAYFGHDESPRTFYLAQVRPDDSTDLVAYLGNTEAGVDSPDGMTVFGFGRGPDTTPLLQGEERFLIGFYPGRIQDEADHEKFNSYIQNKIQTTKTLKK